MFLRIFYYKLDVVNEDLIADVKKEIIIDTDVFNNNQINLIDSKYSGSHRIVGLGTTTFKYNIPWLIRKHLLIVHLLQISIILLNLQLLMVQLKILKLLNGGRKYEYTPGVSTISSAYGKDAILEIDSTFNWTNWKRLLLKILDLIILQIIH